jgi:hypothetical protein
VSSTISGLHESQRKIERRAFLDGPFGPDFTTVPVNDPLHGSEPDSGSGKFRRGVKPLEGAKQASSIGRVEPSAIVTNKISGASIVTELAELNAGGGAFRGELESIPQ